MVKLLLVVDIPEHMRGSAGLRDSLEDFLYNVDGTMGGIGYLEPQKREES